VELRIHISKDPHGVTNKKNSKPTTSICNQEDKENSRYENFDAASSLMLFHCRGKESRLQELYNFIESAPTSSLQLLST
jgi:hypothetical protein